MPAITVTCTLRNPSTTNYVVSATDEVAHTQLLTNLPMGPDDTQQLTLVADESGAGRLTYGADGYVPNRNDSVSDGATFDLP